MKMLYILNVAKKVNNFSYTSMIAAQKCGFDYHIAGNWSYETEDSRIRDEAKYGIKIHQIDFVRNPYNLKNRKAYNQLMDLCKKEKFDVIHCNTPIGGLLGRLVASKCGTKTTIYQAHGFHFYKGSSLFSWLVYYPIEKWLAHKTDILITINKEDYELAKRKIVLKQNGFIEYVPGVGIDLKKYSSQVCSNLKRKEIGLSDFEIGVISIGDLVKRKNYVSSLYAISKTKNKNIKLFICGSGPEEKRLSRLIKKLKLQKRVFLLGYRNDIQDILPLMDIFLISSKQEGMPRSLMEAMACGLPCVASNIRGNSDLLSGICKKYLCEHGDSAAFANSLDEIAGDINLRKELGKHNLKAIVDYNTDIVIERLCSIYRSIGNNN